MFHKGFKHIHSKKTIMTGIMGLAQDIFSLNLEDFKICGVLDPIYQEHFGFT